LLKVDDRSRQAMIQAFILPVDYSRGGGDGFMEYGYSNSRFNRISGEWVEESENWCVLAAYRYLLSYNRIILVPVGTRVPVHSGCAGRELQRW